jgi:hypothetical protein
MHRAQDGCPGRVEGDVLAVQDADIRSEVVPVRAASTP